MPAWFYMLRLKSGKLYSGATTNLEQRWKDHQSGTACRTTKHDPPVSLVYHEAHHTFSDARRREAQIKRWSARKKEALANGDAEALKKLARCSSQHPRPGSSKAGIVPMIPANRLKPDS